VGDGQAHVSALKAALGRAGEWRGGSAEDFRPMSTNFLYSFLNSIFLFESLISKFNPNLNLY
jgi:hypothetical protein